MTISPCTGDARSVFPFLYGGSKLAKHFRHTLRCSATPQPLQLSLSLPPPAAACCRCCCCFCATCRHCYFAFVVRNKSPSLRFVVSVVSLRCLCLCLVACLDHSWVSRSLESDLVFVRRVLAILSVSPVFGLRLCRAC